MYPFGTSWSGLGCFIVLLLMFLTASVTLFYGYLRKGTNTILIYLSIIFSKHFNHATIWALAEYLLAL